MKKTLFYLSGLWMAAAFGYALYESFNETGLYAALLGWQLETFGSAELKLTTLATGIIYGLPALITMTLTRSAAQQRTPDPVAGQRNAAIVFLTVAVLLVVAGIVGYAVNMNYTARQQSEPVANATATAQRVVPVNLDASAAVPSMDGADGVAVTGWLRRDAQYGLEEKGYGGKKTVYCPLVNRRWKASEQVRIFLRADPSKPIALSRAGGGGGGGGPSGMKLPKGFVAVDFETPEPVEVTIEGTTRPGGLPDYVVSFFKKQGVTPASDYVLLEAQPFYDTPRRSGWDQFAETSYLLTYIALPLAFFFGVFGVVSVVRWRKLFAQRQAAEGFNRGDGF